MPKSPDQGPADAPGVDPALVSYLKRLVTVLTIVMIIGVLSITALLVSRLMSFDGSGVSLPADPLVLPETIRLPEGQSALAFTKGPDWFAIVTDAEWILIFDAKTGVLRQSVEID